MANFPIPFGINLVGKFAYAGKDDTETIRGLTGVTVTLADGTNAYIADAATGNNEFFVVPRQNAGGTPLTVGVTITLTISGKDPVTGAALPSMALDIDLQVEPAPPPHSTHITQQEATTLTVTPVPADRGTLTISLT